jgi:molecular chaperone GrpE
MMNDDHEMTNADTATATDDDKSNATDASNGERDPIEIVKKERDEYLCGWRRAKADYENLIKETQRSKEEYVKFANEQALLRLLPAIDQFDVALSFTPSLDLIPVESRKPFGNWMTGLEAVRSLWMEAARELGLEKIAAAGPFDPNLHEAIGEEMSEQTPGGDVIRATVNGWMLNGKVIRAAKVIVSKQ